MYQSYAMAADPAIFQNPQCITPTEISSQLVLLKIKHWDFQMTERVGHIIVHRLIVADVEAFFKRAYEIKFPIHSCKPVHLFDWNDKASCAANNSSAHNMRHLDDGRLSKHAIGCAFDINPLQNPCFVLEEKTLQWIETIPPEGVYVPGTPGTLQKGDELVELMLSFGWAWGGNWDFPKDYQHFQIVPKELEHFVK